MSWINLCYILRSEDEKELCSGQTIGKSLLISWCSLEGVIHIFILCLTHPLVYSCPQLSGGLQNRNQSGHQEAVQTFPVGALRQAGLQRAEAPQTHETWKCETRHDQYNWVERPRPSGATISFYMSAGLQHWLDGALTASLINLYV